MSFLFIYLFVYNTYIPPMRALGSLHNNNHTIKCNKNTHKYKAISLKITKTQETSKITKTAYKSPPK